MTNEELDKMKYKICCPICDNYKCLRGTEKCEAELWKKWRIRRMTNELSVEDAIEVFKFMKREVLEGSKEDKVIDMAIKALKQQSKTNGDAIRDLFPNISIVNAVGGDILLKVDKSHLICSESWWNSPYKESDKSETN